MFGIGGAPDVDWAVWLESGAAALQPGSQVKGLIRLTAREPIEVRRGVATFVGTEEYAYDHQEHSETGRDVDRRWEKEDVVRQELEILGPGRIAAGETRDLPMAFTIPADAPPSHESSVLRMRWKIEAWLDVGGRDPRIEQAVAVWPSPAQPLLVDPAALGRRHDVTLDDRTWTIWVDPAPLRIGFPFGGAVDVMGTLDLSTTRVELKLVVSTLGESGLPGAYLLGKLGVSSSSKRGVSEAQTLWQGQLGPPTTPAPGVQRSLFAGQVPPGTNITASFPHATAKAMIDVTLARRLRPDQHVTRPVAIAPG